MSRLASTSGLLRDDVEKVLHDAKARAARLLWMKLHAEGAVAFHGRCKGDAMSRARDGVGADGRRERVREICGRSIGKTCQQTRILSVEIERVPADVGHLHIARQARRATGQQTEAWNIGRLVT